MSLSIDQLSANNQNNKQQDDEYRRFFAQNLETFGLNVETEICLDNNDYFGKTNTENPKRALIFTKIHAPWKILASGAEALRIKMPLKLKDKRIFRCAGAGTSSSSAAWHFGRKLKQSFKKLSNFGASDRTSDAMDVQENGSIGEEATASR
uniref:Anoctamin dimerisation domain-containing protein n=1 Tax=Romanomermis culicivorax TaxID=13658 RepID=A0A915L2Z9_ROMCU